jgi:hypothetical protein
MKQALHIFRKDVRHLRPELAMYGGLLVAFALVTPLLWPGSSPHNEVLQMFATLLTFLLPVSWLVLTARLVHEESLVGDRQFWVTRPYRWTSLLGAKVLFLAVCLLAPVGAVQIYLVLRSGLELGPALPGVAVNFLNFVLIVLWFALLAAATGMIARTLLALTLLVVSWAGLFALVSNLTMPRLMPPFVSQALSVVVGCSVVALLVYQYATRRTQRTWRMLLFAVVFYFGLYFCCSATNLGGLSDALIRRQYPVAKGGMASLTFTPGSFTPVARDSSGQGVGGMVALDLPVHYQDADPTARVQDANVSFTIDAPGYHYVSPWRTMAMEADDLTVLVPSSVLQRVAGVSVRMHLSVAAERLSPDQPVTVKVSDSFRAPDHGVCVLIKGDRMQNNISCRYPAYRPSPTRVSGPVSASALCGVPTHTGVAVVRDTGSGAGVDPMNQHVLQLGGAVCPGAELSFLPYVSAGKFRLELELPPLELAQYIAR